MQDDHVKTRPAPRPVDLDEMRTIPSKSCDLIMKGGITSGVVYPQAIIEIASEYELRSIGGASAGAIAAAFAAAAEYGRGKDEGGYRRLAEVVSTIPTQLRTLFQPAPPLRSLFDAALDIMSRPKGDRAQPAFYAVARLLITQAGVKTLIGGVGGGILGGAAAFSVGALVRALSPWPAGLGALTVGGAMAGAMAGAIAGSLWQVAAVVIRTVDKNFFGICPGPTQPGRPVDEPGLTDWLHTKLNYIAGLDEDGPPLTFRDLKQPKGEGQHPIVLEVMTTNLSEGRPYRLPFSEKRFAFRPSEFWRLFPDPVLAHLRRTQEPAFDEGYFKIVDPDEMPVVVAVRMSLSFPLLLSTVPLHAVDYTFEDKSQRDYIPHTFSDGGITSNLPIHFFDSPLPCRPTFAINLEKFDAARHKDDVDLPTKAGKGIALEATSITKTTDLVGALVATMKNWQDNMRLQQPGTRERVVTVRLGPGQGGLNLTMPSPVVKALMTLGQRAGYRLREQFNFRDHKWRRYLVWSNALEDALRLVRRRYVEGDDTPAQETFEDFLADFERANALPGSLPTNPTSYRPNQRWLSEVNLRTSQLMALVGTQDGAGKTQPLACFNDPAAPQPHPEPVIALQPRQ